MNTDVLKIAAKIKNVAGPPKHPDTDGMGVLLNALPLILPYHAATMSTLSGATRTAFLVFFASHIPITLLVDGQAFLPRSLYPTAIQDVLNWYTTTFADNLMQPPVYDVWFSSVVACEILFQLPFFAYAVYTLLDPARANGRGKFRSACLIYGSHTATTLVPILATIATDPETNWEQRATLFGFYLPYLVFPAWLVYIAVCNEDVFGGNHAKSNKAA